MSGVNGYISRHTLYKQNGLKPLINLNNGDDIEMNSGLNNGDVSCGIGLINNNALYQFHDPTYFNKMDWGIKNGDVSGGLSL